MEEIKEKIEELSISQVADELGIQRQNIYPHLKNLNIVPQKKGRKSFLTRTQINLVKERIEPNKNNLKKTIQKIDIRQVADRQQTVNRQIQDKSQTDSRQTNESNQIITLLKVNLSDKDKQLLNKEKDLQEKKDSIKRLEKALDKESEQREKLIQIIENEQKLNLMNNLLNIDLSKRKLLLDSISNISKEGKEELKNTIDILKNEKSNKKSLSFYSIVLFLFGSSFFYLMFWLFTNI